MLKRYNSNDLFVQSRTIAFYDPVPLHRSKFKNMHTLVKKLAQLLKSPHDSKLSPISQKTLDMNLSTIELNAELLRNMSIIAEDENLLKRAAKYLRKLAAEKEDPTLMTKEEFFARVEKAEEEIAEGKGITFTNKDDMNAWLNSL